MTPQQSAALMRAGQSFQQQGQTAGAEERRRAPQSSPLYAAPQRPWQDTGRPYDARLGGIPGSMNELTLEEIIRLLQQGGYGG
jgi:hypothetical protein